MDGTSCGEDKVSLLFHEPDKRRLGDCDVDAVLVFFLKSSALTR